MLTTRPPRARHDGTAAGGVSTGVEALLRRSHLAGDEHVLRAAGVPLLMAAIVAGGPDWTTYFVEPGDTLSGIARRHGTDAHSLARINGVGQPETLLAGERLTVPVPPFNPASSARRRATASGLHPVGHRGVPVITYRVRDGDTAREIAIRTGTSERAVLAANGLRSSSMIRAGQVLVLPSLPARDDRRRTARRSTRPVVHVVRPGDTVSAIARRHRVAAGAVLRANRLRHDSLIRPGQKLVLPGATARPRRARGAASSISVHIVRRGETVTAIARRYGVAVPAVLRLNQLGSRTLISPGHRLLVPAGDGAARTAQRRAAGSGASGSGASGSGPSLTATFLGRTYSDAVVSAANANLRALRLRPVPSPAQARGLVRTTAATYGVDPALAMAVAQAESGFDHRQVSPANAVGLMQMTPSAGAWSGELIGRRLDLLDAQDNVTAGVVLLAALMGSTQDESLTLAGYYQGLASVRRHGFFADTRRYVATVRTLAHRFQ